MGDEIDKLPIDKNIQPTENDLSLIKILFKSSESSNESSTNYGKLKIIAIVMFLFVVLSSVLVDKFIIYLCGDSLVFPVKILLFTVLTAVTVYLFE